MYLWPVKSFLGLANGRQPALTLVCLFQSLPEKLKAGSKSRNAYFDYFFHQLLLLDDTVCCPRNNCYNWHYCHIPYICACIFLTQCIGRDLHHRLMDPLRFKLQSSLSECNFKVYAVMIAEFIILTINIEGIVSAWRDRAKTELLWRKYTPSESVWRCRETLNRDTFGCLSHTILAVAIFCLHLYFLIRYIELLELNYR